MCKKSFITMKSGKKTHKVYLSDVLSVHSVVKRQLPPIPTYSEVLSPKM